jgi:hypothetical protein
VERTDGEENRGTSKKPQKELSTRRFGVDPRDALLCYLLGSFRKLWKFATSLLFESAHKRVIIFNLVLRTPDLIGKT